MLPGAGVEDIDALLGVIGWMVTPGARLMLVNAHFILSDQYHDTTLRLYDQVANDSMRTLLMTLSRESLSPVCSWCPCPFPHALIFTASQRIIEIFPLYFGSPSFFPTSTSITFQPDCSRVSQPPIVTSMLHHPLATRTMRAFALMLLVFAAVAAAFPAPHPDGPLEVPSDSIKGALNEGSFEFKWSTLEYCGDDGSLRAHGKWSVTGFSHDYDIDDRTIASIQVSGENLYMTYNFDTASK